MKVLFLGDVMGRAGRDAVKENLMNLKESLSLDFVIVNAENAAAGYGLTKKIAIQLIDAGVDAITLGNHAWDQKEMLSYKFG